MKRASRAFTMIEMIVVIALIGAIAAITVPRMFYKSPQAEWKTVWDELNNMVLFARQEAISQQKLHRLTFQTSPNAPDFVVIEEENPDPEKPGHVLYSQVSSYYFTTKYQFHETLKLKAFYYGKEELLSASNKGTASCYVIPDGLVQDVVIHMSRKDATGEDGATFKMSPFFGRFEMIEGFVKPER